jgi:hypothetical protein
MRHWTEIRLSPGLILVNKSQAGVMTALQQRGSDYVHCELKAGQEVRLCSADVHPDRALERWEQTFYALAADAPWQCGSRLEPNVGAF